MLRRLFVLAADESHFDENYSDESHCEEDIFEDCRESFDDENQVKKFIQAAIEVI